MAGSSPVLLGFLLLFFYYASCQSLMTINYYDYTIYFDDYNFQQFHECLCGVTTRKCNATSYRTEDKSTLYDVTNIVREPTTVPFAYYNSYSCTSYREINTTLIVCSRLIKTNLKEDQPDTFTSCQNAPVNTLLVSCSSGCYDILLVDSQNITSTDKESERLGCSSCQTETSTAPTTTKSITTATKPTTTAIKPTTTATISTTITIKSTTTTTKPTPRTGTTTTAAPTIDEPKHDDPSEDNLPLIAGVVVAVIVILIITGLIIVIVWWRRKRCLKPPSTSQHNTTSTRAIPQNYADTDEVHGYVNVNGHGPSATNPFAAANNESMTIGGPGLQSDQAVVFPEEVIRKIRTAPAKSNDIGNMRTEYSSIDEVVPPESGYYNTCNIGDSPVSSSATPLSTTSTPPSQPTNRNTSGYEEVSVNNMTTRSGVPINHYEEIPDQAYGDDKDGSKAPKEHYYTNAL